MRTIVSILSVIVLITVPTPHLDSMTGPDTSKIKAQIAAFPVGSMIEIQFSVGTKVVGQLDSLGEDRVVLQIQDGDHMRKSAYMLADIAAVRRAVPSRNNLQVTPDSLGAVLGEMALDRNIKLMMRDGTYVEGKVVQASQDAITVKVKKSEPRNHVAGPEAVLATSEIGAVYLRKAGPVALPIVLGVGGGLLGTIAAAVGADNVHNGYGALVVLGMVGGAAGGALLGREAAKETVSINVIQPREP